MHAVRVRCVLLQSLTDSFQPLPSRLRITSLALGKSCDNSNSRVVTSKNMGNKSHDNWKFEHTLMGEIWVSYLKNSDQKCKCIVYVSLIAPGSVGKSCSRNAWSIGMTWYFGFDVNPTIYPLDHFGIHMGRGMLYYIQVGTMLQTYTQCPSKVKTLPGSQRKPITI